MPYVKNEKREIIGRQSRIPLLVLEGIECAGDLNYVFCMIAKEYLTKKGEVYQTYNDIIGALDNAKDEFRRRKQHPYENGAIERNGDVF